MQVGPASDEVRSTTRIPCSGWKLTRPRLPIGSQSEDAYSRAAKPGGTMKLGMNMLLWSTDVTGPEYLPVFEQLRDIGYEGIEVPIFDTSPAAIAGYEQLGEQLAAPRPGGARRRCALRRRQPDQPRPGSARTRAAGDERRRRHLRHARREDDLRPAGGAARLLHGHRPDGGGAEARGREPARSRRACRDARRDDRRRVPEPLRDVPDQLRRRRSRARARGRPPELSG